MPMYEYECKKCHKRFDNFESIQEHGTKKVQCPECKSASLERVYTSVQVQTSKKS
jgi:putative FmdB family regulatory protein